MITSRDVYEHQPQLASMLNSPYPQGTKPVELGLGQKYPSVDQPNAPSLLTYLRPQSIFEILNRPRINGM